MSQASKSHALAPVRYVRRQVHRQVRRRSQRAGLTEFLCSVWPASEHGALRFYAATCAAEAEAMHARAQARAGVAP